MFEFGIGEAVPLAEQDGFEHGQQGIGGTAAVISKVTGSLTIQVSFAQIVTILLHYFVPFVHVVCSKVCRPDAVFLHMDYVVFRRKILPPAR